MWVGCFGFNSPLRQYFSLYLAVSKRKGERREMKDERKLSKCHRVLVRYIIHLYCLAVQAGFYSDVVEC